MRSILLIFLSVALSALSAVGARETAPIQTAGVEYRSVPREYRLDGVVEAINRTTVSAQTQGQVEEISYDVDDFVEKNAELVRLKDTEPQAQVMRAVAERKTATAQLQQAKDEYARVQGLHAKKLISDSAMDKATAERDSAQARLEAAVAGLEQAEEQLRYTRIHAPYSGIVTHRHVELGETVSPGQPVMTGISLDELRVIVDVPQSLIPSVRPSGDRHTDVRVYLPQGGALSTDKVTVFPYAELSSNTFKVRLDLPEGTKGLFPGMFVKTGFVTGEKRELVVPKQAVVYRSEVTGVYVLNGGRRLHFRQIRLGRDLGDALVVLAGLTEGEQVALDPIAAGAALKAQAAGEAAGQHHD